MRLVLVAAMLAACGGYEGRVYGTCSSDEACAGSEVCARSGECLGSADISPPITFQWTIDGLPPDPTTCAPHPRLHLILFSDDGDDPDLTLDVPCTAGKSLVLDRIPEHLLLLAFDFGPADVPDPGSEPNDVGWTFGVLPGDGSLDVTFYLSFKAH